MFTFIKKNLQIWMRLSTFANEKERNLIDMCTFKNIIINNHFLCPLWGTATNQYLCSNIPSQKCW